MEMVKDYGSLERNKEEFWLKWAKRHGQILTNQNRYLDQNYISTFYYFMGPNIVVYLLFVVIFVNLIK